MSINLQDISTVSHGLNRPECVLTHEAGYLFASDWDGNGGVSITDPGGRTRKLLSNWHHPIRPNGIALEKEGNFLLAHLGDESGGVFRLTPRGQIHPVLDSLGGQPLPPTNFVTIDHRDRLWITVSTRHVPRAAAYRSDVNDGFILVVEGDKARIATDSLGYTNECLVADNGRTLYVNETFARRLSAFSINSSGTLGPRRTVARFGPGTFPDGLCQDVNADLWVTSIISNRVIRVRQDGTMETVIEDSDGSHLDSVEQAYQDHTMGRPHLDKAHSQKLMNISSLAFGGTDLSTGYMGCLLGDSLYCVKLPVSGIPGHAWNADVSRLRELFERPG